MKYMLEKDNVVEDALSRLPVVDGTVSGKPPFKAFHLLQSPDETPIKCCVIRHWTARDSHLSQVLPGLPPNYNIINMNSAYRTSAHYGVTK